jgi:hypothetical protein
MTPTVLPLVDPGPGNTTWLVDLSDGCAGHDDVAVVVGGPDDWAAATGGTLARS